MNQDVVCIQYRTVQNCTAGALHTMGKLLHIRWRQHLRAWTHRQDSCRATAQASAEKGTSPTSEDSDSVQSVWQYVRHLHQQDL